MKSSERQILKAKAHPLKPVVLLGSKGLTQAVHDEIDIALQSHELIKIKINGQEREDKKKMILDICEKSQAELIQQIGNIAVIYRKNLDE